MKHPITKHHQLYQGQNVLNVIPSFGEDIQSLDPDPRDEKTGW